MQLLKIERVPIRYRIQMQQPRLEMRQAQNPQVQMSSAPATVKIQTRDIQVRLDTIDMRRSMGLRSTGDMMELQAEKGMKAAQTATAEFSRFGTQVGQIQDGVTIAQLIAQKMFSQPETITAFLPSVGPQITWQPGEIKMEGDPGDLTTEWEINKNIMDYIPGKFQIVIEQYPGVKIEYLGEPNYVPPSAAPGFNQSQMA